MYIVHTMDECNILHICIHYTYMYLISKLKRYCYKRVIIRRQINKRIYVYVYVYSLYDLLFRVSHIPNCTYIGACGHYIIAALRIRIYIYIYIYTYIYICGIPYVDSYAVRPRGRPIST